MSFSIFPRTVYKTKSKISGEIVVQEQLGLYTLHVQNLIQSGGIVKGIWKKPLHFVQGKPFVSKCLMLGLGGGTVVQLIKLQFPQAKIVCIEIDPEIIKIGKKYFGLGKIADLETVEIDAFEWVRIQAQSQHKNTSDGGPRGLLRGERRKFDLIIVDLYLGDKFPPQAEKDKFLAKVKNLLSKGGMTIFNRLRSDETENFEKKLKKYFSSVKKVETPTNLFFLAKV